jgi:acyl-CoA synthetase (AMP-forming)/AMP-acid ligase II
MNVADQLYRSSALYGDAIAARCGDEARTFAEMEERTNRLAQALLARGLVKGDRVATWFENSIRCVELDFALAKAGFVRVSVNPRLTAREAQYILQDSGARCFVWGASFDGQVAAATQDAPELMLRLRCDESSGETSAGEDYERFVQSGDTTPPRVEIDPEDLYCLFYTSGTTGRPKGVMLSHRSILHVSWNLLMEIGPLEIGEKVLLMQPMSHGAGFFALPQYMKGGCSVIMRTFDPAEVMRLAALHEIEAIKLVPTMLQRILRVPGLKDMKLPKLRAMIYGASPMPEQPLKQAIEIFGPHKLVQIYGQSECPVTLSVLHASEHRLDQPWPERLVSAGRPWATVEMRVVGDDFEDVEPGGIGEVVLRGPQLMSGYWKRPEQTAQAIREGWLRTQDMGRMDAHGYVYLLGRKDEMIISGGFNIAPREVEDVLYQHAGVQEAAVVGEADAEWGQAVVAYVVMREGYASSVDELIALSKDQLGFKRPKRFYRMGELPKNAAGKIQKSALTPALAIESMSAARQGGMMDA